MAKIKNKEALQSYILTTARYDFSKYEKRILYRLVELAQCETQALNFPEDCRKIDHDLFNFITIEMPYGNFLSTDEKNETDEKKRNTNHAQVWKALKSLQIKIIDYEDNKTKESLSIIANPIHKKRSDTVTFIINPRIWDVILDFSRGYRKIELLTTMEFNSVYSMRFYELFSEQKVSKIFTVEELKKMFKIENQYKGSNNNKIISKVIDPAKKELDEKSPYSFDFDPIKKGRGGKIVSIKFTPIFKPENKDINLEQRRLQQQLSSRWTLSKQEVEYLHNNFGFTEDEIRKNIDTFKDVIAVTDLLNELARIKAKISEYERLGKGAGNVKGYVIISLRNAVTRIVKKTQGVTVEPGQGSIHSNPMEMLTGLAENKNINNK